MQVLGHSKTVCVLLGGWLFLGDRVSGKQLLGMALAVLGMVLYGFSTCGPCSACLLTVTPSRACCPCSVSSMCVSKHIIALGQLS